MLLPRTREVGGWGHNVLQAVTCAQTCSAQEKARRVSLKLWDQQVPDGEFRVPKLQAESGPSGWLKRL